MQPCEHAKDGEHRWRDCWPETADGSTLLVCTNPGCEEIAYRLRTPPVKRRRGVPIR